MILGSSGKTKIVWHKGLSSETSYTFQEQVLENFDVFSKELILEDELSSEKSIQSLGKGIEFKFIEYVFKEGKPIVETNLINFFDEKEVVVYPHAEGIQIKQPDGTDALFYVTVTPGYFNPSQLPNYRDVLMITLRSLDEIDIWQSILPENTRVDKKTGAIRTGTDGKYRTGV